MKISYRFANLNLLLILFVSAALSGCGEESIETPYNSAAVTENLYLIPTSVLDSVKKSPKDANDAKTPANGYKTSMFEGKFQSSTFFVKGEKTINLSVYNSASNKAGLNQGSDSVELISSQNDIAEAFLVIELSNSVGLKSIKVNESTRYPSHFTSGSAALPGKGGILKTNGRLPGFYALVSLGTLVAQGTKELKITVEGECNLIIHFDVYGKANCDKVFVNAPDFGTSVGTTVSCENPGADGGTTDGSSSKDGGSKDGYTPDSVIDATTDASVDTSKDVTVTTDTAVDVSKDVTTTTDTYCPPTNCTLPQWYWLLHSGCTPGYIDEVTSALPIWLGTKNGKKSILVNTHEIAKAVLEMNVYTYIPKGSEYGKDANGITQLYAHLLAAKLSIIQEGADSKVIDKTIADADAFLSQYDYNDWWTLSLEAKLKVSDWVCQLKLYNGGEIGPGKCKIPADAP